MEKKILLARKINRNFFFLILEKISILGLNFIFALILPLFISYESFSKFLVALAVSSIVWMFMDLGLNIKTIDEVSKRRTILPETLHSILNAKIVTSLIVMIGLFIFVISVDYPFDLKVTILILSGAFIINNFGELFISVFKGLELMQYSTLVNAVYALLVVSLGTIALFFGGNIILLAMIYLIGRVFFFVTGFYLYTVKTPFGELRPSFHFSNCIEELKDSVVKIQASFFLLNSLNLFVLFFSISSFGEVGYVGAAGKMIAALYIGFTSYPESLFPKFAKYSVDIEVSKQILRNSLIKHILLLIPMMVILFVIADKVVLAFWGTEYAQVAHYFKYFILLLPLFSIITHIHYYFVSVNRHQRAFFYLLIFLVSESVALVISNFLFGLSAVPAAFIGVAGLLLIAFVTELYLLHNNIRYLRI